MVLEKALKKTKTLRKKKSEGTNNSKNLGVVGDYKPLLPPEPHRAILWRIQRQPHARVSTLQSRTKI